MSYERITMSNEFDGPVRETHEERYRIASKYLHGGEVVLDAGCGIGYGEEVLRKYGRKFTYLGVDKKPIGSGKFCDFESGEGLDIKEFDIFIGFEIIEHLDGNGVFNFLKIAIKAKKYIILSTPVIPNSNPFHKQHFKPETIPNLMSVALDWELERTQIQNGTYGIYIFKRKNNE